MTKPRFVGQGGITMRFRAWRGLGMVTWLGTLCSPSLAEDPHPANRPPAAPAAATAVQTSAPTTLEAPSEPAVVFTDSGSTRRGVYFRGEAIFLDRNTPDVLLSQADGSDPNRPLGTVVMSGEDLNFDMQSGARLTVGYQYDDRHAIEGTFTGFLDWNAKAQATGLFDLDAGAIGIAPAFSSAQLQTADYSSSLNMVEANHITRIGTHGTFLAGVRYVDLEEDLHRFSVFIPNFIEGSYNVKTRNFMVGPQLGGSWRADLTNSLSLDASAKAAFLGNFFDVGTDLRDSFGFGIANDHEQEVGIATVWDLGATLRWRLTNSLTAHGGYQVLVIQGAALAIDQNYDTTDTGNIVYHGPNVGLTWQR